ncbi:MAG TPA: ornithine carbamoyltransferase [Fibrobacteraceae bacterium]|nr:ornithine carbamoyltransferase [Fibrobacteraceae bacterium]
MLNREQHLLTLKDWSPERILETIALAIQLKAEIKTTGPSSRLRGQTIGMFFEKPSLRTVTTFQVGIHQLGGEAVMLDPDSIGLGKRESVSDVAHCLSRWVNAIVVRCFEQRLVEALAEYGSVPVINALTDDFHPCQALAFAQTLQEHLGDLHGQTIAFIGDGNNVANSLAILAAKLGMNFSLACPNGFEQPQEVVEYVRALFQKNGGSYRLFHEPREAVKDAQVLYSDVWVSMGQEGQKDSKQSHFLPFQINDELLALAPKDCKVSHCLPAHRGEEITDSVMDGPASFAFDEAENRLHAQKAVMWQLMPPTALG